MATLSSRKVAEPGQQCGSGGLIAAGIVVKGDGYGEEIDSGTFDAFARYRYVANHFGMPFPDCFS
jgi:hypothetical protein